MQRSGEGSRARRKSMSDSTGKMQAQLMTASMMRRLVKDELGNQQINELEDSLCCPITGELMVEPVIVRQTGITYEKSTLLEHMQTNKTDPTNSYVITEEDLIPNRAIENAIVAYKKEAKTRMEKQGFEERIQALEDELKNERDARQAEKENKKSLIPPPVPLPTRSSGDLFNDFIGAIRRGPFGN